MNIKVKTIDIDVAVKFYTKVIGLGLQDGTDKKNLIDQLGIHIEFQKIK